MAGVWRVWCSLPSLLISWAAGLSFRRWLYDGDKGRETGSRRAHSALRFLGSHKRLGFL